MRDDQLGDAFSDLARQRRQAAEDASLLDLPAYIIEIEEVEASYTFRLPAIPFAHIDHEMLSELIHRTYGAEPQEPDLGALINEIGLDAVGQMSGSERRQRALIMPGSSIRFRNGRFPVRYDFIEIPTIIIDQESVFVKVRGTTTAAEAIIYEVVELLWRSAGVEKKYAELENLLLIKTYVTVTRVDFGDVARHMLGSAFYEFLSSCFSDGGEFRGSFGSRSHRDNFGPPSVTAGTVSLDELHMQVSRYDLGTGFTYTGLIKFSTMARDDYGTGRMQLVTHMPYEEHATFVASLAQQLREASQSSP